MTLRITFQNQLRVLLYHLLGSGAMIIVLVILGFEKYTTTAFGVMWVLYTLPVLFLHIEYYVKNKGMQVKVLDDGISLGLNNGVWSSYLFSDFDKVILYKAASLDKGSSPMLPLENYHFVRVFLKNGGVIIITCLMSPDLEGALIKMKLAYQRKKIFFASMNLYK